MATTELLMQELALPEAPARSRHPMDSSGILLGLMQLSHKAAVASGQAGGSLDGVISKPVLCSLLSALHYRDDATMKHCRRVGMLSVGLAQHLGWQGRHLKVLEVASLLHDIGKIGVPDNILFKPGALSPDESELMALHQHIAVDVLQACRAHAEVLQIVAQAHSQFDGVVEEASRIGNEVHQGARILAICDAYDSLRTDQVYREGQSHEEIMRILMEAAGTRFDGNVVCALSRWLESDGGPLSQQAADLGRADQAPGATDAQEAQEAAELGQIFSYLYLLESLYDGFYLVDSDLRFVVWNGGMEKLLGRPAQEILNQVWTSRTLACADRQGKPLGDHECSMNRVIAEGKPTTSEARFQHADGYWIEVETQSVPLLDAKGELQGVAEIFRDASRSSRRPKEYNKLKLQASRDPLTSVANRGELETQLVLLINKFSERRDAPPFSVVFLDVDHFKSINDNFGHGVGDQVLVDLAKILQHETYSGEFVGRYGGEEFVVLCPETDLEQAVKRADRLRSSIVRANVGDLGDRPVTVSLGVAQAEDGDSMESLLRRADKAMYMAKAEGRNCTRALTNRQMHSKAVAAPSKNKHEQVPEGEAFRFRGEFRACIAADMIVYKLGGFVDDEKANLVQCNRQGAVLRLGRKGLLPFWGGCDDDRPIEVEIEFGEECKGETRARSAVRQVNVEVNIRPLGWVRKSEVFHNRAKRVFKELRSHFAGELTGSSIVD